ncbi:MULTISPECIES: phosphodiester glycosidase family protein [Flavobacterium]|uniref:Phosphodiester glycosidase family protein n=1 Tax=Flavobacterium lipolyticum TaxID=2893754 RepID=A0ABS8M3A3_9FLAO|nr:MULTISPECIES: phosphodiester glycosidase family protein [unclassified Flavobacterium]MCC9019308.1 phosphodiester glycosidase family protein [Flavobacterium sp. F-126]
MKTKIGILVLIIILLGLFVGVKVYADDQFVVYKADLKEQDLRLYWKNDKGGNFGSIENLKLWLEKNKATLKFAMNGGMYKRDNSPQGLYIEKQEILVALDTLKAAGNFYLKPNGVFYLTTKRIARICKTEDFRNDNTIEYATQSGPMLVIDGKIHPDFNKASSNLNIRNGVGILPDGKVIFVLSKKEINFYDFANYFKSLGCKNALYLDGFVSRAYVPSENWIQTDGNFGALFAVTEKKE